MTQEEKAKAYDEVIKQLRTMMPNWESLSYNGKTFLQDLVHIIPELKESEDWIPKEIIKYLKEKGDFRSCWIAWLEKQGEKTSDKIVEKARTEKQRVLLTETDGSANIDWDCRSLDDVKILLKCGLEFIRTIEANKQMLTDNRFGGCSFRVPTRYDKGIKQGEQKPAIEMKSAEESLGIDSETYNKIVDECIYGEQKPSWSDEDEEMYKEVLTDIIYAKNNLKAKECHGLSKRAMEAFNWFSNRYKSLRPQSTWRPSEEQMKVLNEVLNFAANHESLHWNDYIFGTLNNLIIQLKKLRED